MNKQRVSASNTFLFNLRYAIVLSMMIFCTVAHGRAVSAESSFFDRHRHLLQVAWTQPFGYESVRSNHAPLGPYLGNGDVGVVAYTSANSQTLRISKVDFVTDGWNDWAGNGAAALPVGEACISVDGAETDGFQYSMNQLSATLNMQSATQTQIQMQTWLCPEDNLIVTELNNNSAVTATIRVVLSPLQHPDCSLQTAINGDIAQVARRTKSGAGIRWVSRAGISARILGGRNLKCEDDSAEQSTRQVFQLNAGTRAFVLMYVSGGGKGDDARWASARKSLAELTRRKIERQRKKHQAWWKEMWHRSYVDTNDTLLNQQYLTSIYLLASAYRAGAPSCGGMYGVWNMEDNMMYHGDIHLNYNSQAGFYSTFSANRPELTLPFFAFLERVMPEGRRRAKEDMGQVHPSLQGKQCRGLLFPVSALGIGEFYGGYWQQTMDAPFNVPLWSWYYEYTGDIDFLRNRAYPFIRECGDFYEDYLLKEDDGKTYRYNIVTGGHENSWDMNPPSELALVEQTFRLLLRYSKVLGIDHERRALWQDIVDHLPAYTIVMPTKHPNQGQPVFAKNEDGWDHPTHVIQMHCVYPCETLNLRSDTTLLRIGKNTLYYYGVSQQGFTETMNELGLSAFVMGARIGFSPEILLEKLRVLSARHQKNLLITDGHHCLEKTALVETINSMMLQSVDDILYLFPCWPEQQASFTNLRAKGAFLVSATTNGNNLTALSVRSECGNICRIHNPWRNRSVRVTCEGKKIQYDKHGETITFNTQAGRAYEISAD